MIRIKFEVEEEEEKPLPIESKNVGFPEKNVVVAAKVPNKVFQKNKPKLDNFTTNSVAVCSKSIKTEPAESSLSLTTQLNNSLNIQSLLRQNRIQNGWTTNEQSIPIGTQQQQQQFLLLPKMEPIVSEIQEVPLLDQSSTIPNLNSNSGVTTTTTNCDTTTKMSPGPRADLGCRAKLNKLCYSVPMEPEPLPPPSADNLESASNDNEQDSDSGSISGFDPLSASSTTAEVAAPSAEAAVPLLIEKKPLPLGIPPLTLEEKKARQRENRRLWYLRKKASLKSLDPDSMAEILRRSRENKRRSRQKLVTNATPEQREQRRLKERESYRRQREKETEEKRQRRLEHERQYNRKYRQQLLANATPEQREQIRLKEVEARRRKMENETEEQRKLRLERGRQYARTVAKPKRELEWQTMTPEEREKKRVNNRKYYISRNKKRMLKKKNSLENEMKSQTSMSMSSINLVDNYCESSTSTMTNHNNNGIVEIGRKEFENEKVET